MSGTHAKEYMLTNIVIVIISVAYFTTYEIEKRIEKERQNTCDIFNLSNVCVFSVFIILLELYVVLLFLEFLLFPMLLFVMKCIIGPNPSIIAQIISTVLNVGNLFTFAIVTNLLNKFVFLCIMLFFIRWFIGLYIIFCVNKDNGEKFDNKNRIKSCEFENFIVHYKMIIIFSFVIFIVAYMFYSHHIYNS